MLNSHAFESSNYRVARMNLIAMIAKSVYTHLGSITKTTEIIVQDLKTLLFC